MEFKNQMRSKQIKYICLYPIIICRADYKLAHYDVFCKKIQEVSVIDKSLQKNLSTTHLYSLFIECDKGYFIPINNKYFVRRNNLAPKFSFEYCYDEKKLKIVAKSTEFIVVPNVFFGITLVIGILNSFVPFAVCSILGLFICQIAFWRTYSIVSSDLLHIIAEVNAGESWGQ